MRRGGGAVDDAGLRTGPGSALRESRPPRRGIGARGQGAGATGGRTRRTVLLAGAAAWLALAMGGAGRTGAEAPTELMVYKGPT
jgi:hypothetical protein